MGEFFCFRHSGQTNPPKEESADPESRILLREAFYIL